MYNRTIQDKKRRNRFKRFEIKTLQNKVVFQDQSLFDNFVESLSLKVFREQNGKRQIESSKLLSIKQKYPAKTKSKNKTFYLFWLNQCLKTSIGKTNLRNCSKTLIKNRCIESGRARSVLRFCKLSRIVLRDKASRGLIPGVTKASW